MLWLKPFVLASLLGIFVVSAQAQVTLDVSKITCDQFLQHKVTDPRFLAIWLSGFYAGKRKNPVVDVKMLEGNADRVSAYCDTHRKVVLMQAVETTLGQVAR
jgi:acid stress chaperone HdeB